MPEVAKRIQHWYVILRITHNTSFPVLGLSDNTISPTRRHAATVTNDIFTREDQEFLIKNRALPSSRILAIETGGCPHAAIREDISANMGALEQLQAKFGCQMLFVESGGDNLAANYSRELADYIIYVIDVAVSLSFADDDLDVEGAEATQVQKLIFAVLKGGDKIPRKGGPGISQSDLLVINKVRNKISPSSQRLRYRTFRDQLTFILSLSVHSFPDRYCHLRWRLARSHGPGFEPHAR